ncbi:hypothetical protein DE146DRAFT_629509 [Phaeosphaeria sp. MPI-PUGE-AT-0046c]|nr:hypothetical protein DE146DRAFT_629509 [Phaeosphaeria sp. MPI-PUGE-AT-0046c]
MSMPHIVQHGSSSGSEACELEWERPTVGSCATSAVTPAVAPTVEEISWRITQDEGASSVKAQVRHANRSLFSDLSSRGNKRLELLASVTVRVSCCLVKAHHSEQKRKRMGSFLAVPPVSGAGEDMALWLQYRETKLPILSRLSVSPRKKACRSRRIGCHAKDALLLEERNAPACADHLVRSWACNLTSTILTCAYSPFYKLFLGRISHKRLGWEVRRSNTKNLPYYFHAETKDSRWEPPAGTNPEQLKEYMAQHHSSKGVAPANFAHSGDKIRVAHLLVKHRESRRPASWREPNITRTRADAEEMIEGYHTQIKAFEAGQGGKSLSELATTESDCSSARKGGDLGFFGRGDMQKEFENAAFALETGQISEPVYTASGVHLIQRL